MKLTVNKYLNARIGEALTTAPCQFYKNPATTIEIDDVVIGTEIEGNSIWYHCKDDGCFYWSGGVEEVEFELPGKIIQNNGDLIEIINTIKNDKSFYLSKKVIGYKGIGIGSKNNNDQMQLCLVVFVDKKILLPLLPQQYIIPPYIIYRGVKILTDVKPVLNPGTHDFIKHPDGAELIPDNDFNPITIGASISNNTTDLPSSGYGTRTIRVKKNKKNYLMSCFHVLLYNEITRMGDFTYNGEKKQTAIFPSPLKNTVFPRKGFTHQIAEGELSGFYDFGLVELQNPFEVENNIDEILITKFVDRKDIQKYINTQVATIGATSYKQAGKITEIKAEIELECHRFQRKYFDVLVAEKISVGGDSGAPVITTDNKLLGYIVGGNGDNATFILPFYHLFLTKGITI